jgi:hypothetical protein
MRRYKQHRGGGSQWAESPNEISDDDAAASLGNGHPKSNPPSFSDSAQVMPGSPGSGSAPGANGPPTTGAVGPGGPLGSS